MRTRKASGSLDHAYRETLDDVTALLRASRAESARSVNALMTATYWLVGKRIFEDEQRGKGRADYGVRLVGNSQTTSRPALAEALVERTCFRCAASF